MNIRLLVRINLGVTALVMIGFGIWALVDPHQLATSQDVNFTSINGRLAIQTIFGGNYIGAGLLFGICGLRPRYHRFGLMAILAIISPILITRGLAMIFESQYSDQHMMKLVMELASVGVTAVLYLVQTRTDEHISQ